MNFEQHINKELTTMNNFFNTQEDITIKKTLNEGFNVFDAIIYSASSTDSAHLYGIVEAKTRDINHDTYTGGVLLQLDKLNSIMNALCKAKNKPKNLHKTLKAYYLVQYNDYTFMFDLENTNFGKVQTRLMPKHTATDGNRTMINKSIYLLQPEDAIIKIKTHK